MSKRKPLPYHVSQAKDSARMAHSEAIRALVKIARGNLTMEEQMRLISLALHEIYRADAAINEIEIERRNA